MHAFTFFHIALFLCVRWVIQEAHWMQPSVQLIRLKTLAPMHQTISQYIQRGRLQHAFLNKSEDNKCKTKITYSITKKIVSLLNAHLVDLPETLGAPAHVYLNITGYRNPNQSREHVYGDYYAASKKKGPKKSHQTKYLIVWTAI